MQIAPRGRDELLARIDMSWQALRARLDKLGSDELNATLADGRSVKETMAGVAFWNETCAPVFAWLRGRPELPETEWYGGTDLGMPAGAPWPKDDVHHAREARWASSVTDTEVRDRLAAAHAAVVATVNTLTDEEIATLDQRTDPSGEPLDDVPPEHPWARMSNVERMWSKASDCTYVLYDELRAQLGDD